MIIGGYLIILFCAYCPLKVASVGVVVVRDSHTDSQKLLASNGPCAQVGEE